MFAGKEKLLPMPLKPIFVEATIQQWGHNFIGEIHPPSAWKHKWILTVPYYFTEWIESFPVRKETDNVVRKFMMENTFSRFDCLTKLVTDNTHAFKSTEMVNFCSNYNVIMGHSTRYYPQCKGLVESSNKSLIMIIKKLLAETKRSWDSKLVYALWEYRICMKKSIGTSPFQLVYGTDVIFLVQLGLPVMKFLREEMEEPNVVQRRILQFIETHQH